MLRDFIAIDFETANQLPSSVCSVGVVMVRDGQIVDSFYSLIQPEPNYYNYWCQRVHGISESKRYKMSEFMTPPKHVNFRAKKLFGAVGNIVDGAVAYIDLDGGGPTELHTHEHNHLFIVTEGEAKILLGDKEVIIHKDEAFLVEGHIPHSCWNNIEGVTKMIGITVV